MAKLGPYFQKFSPFLGGDKRVYVTHWPHWPRDDSGQGSHKLSKTQNKTMFPRYNLCQESILLGHKEALWSSLSSPYSLRDTRPLGQESSHCCLNPSQQGGTLLPSVIKSMFRPQSQHIALSYQHPFCIPYYFNHLCSIGTVCVTWNRTDRPHPHQEVVIRRESTGCYEERLSPTLGRSEWGPS